MPRTARSLGVLTAGAALLVAVAWVVVRTLVGPDVPVVPAAVELGSPAELDDAEADPAPTEAAAPDDTGTRVLGSRTERGALVVSPAPVPLSAAGPDEAPAAPAKASVVAPAPTVPVAPPAAEDPAPAPAAPAEEPPTSRALEVDHDGGCAMPDRAGHGLGQAAARTQGPPGAPPQGQHRRGCSVPDPAERPQRAATLPAPARAPGEGDGHGGGGGSGGGGPGGGPGGAGRGRGPKG